jgi:thiol-disulfide isomerase/thioredoxin
VNRKFLAVVIAIFALAAGIIVTTNEQEVTEVDTGPISVSFKLADLEGVERDFSKWHGQHRILNFWATWCAPCRREIPLLKAFQDQHGAAGVQVIGIAVEFPEPVIAYAKTAEFNYPILVGEQDAMAVAESSGMSFVGLPFTMIVARDGEFISAHMGEIHQAYLDEVAQVLLQLDRGEIDKETARSALDIF